MCDAKGYAEKQNWEKVWEYLGDGWMCALTLVRLCGEHNIGAGLFFSETFV